MKSSETLAEQDQVWREMMPNIRPYLSPLFPTIVTLCGSTRFKDAFIEANFRETQAGNLVFSVGWFSHADNRNLELPPNAKAKVDELHLRKIDLSDEILVLNVGGYVGESTAREIAHARKTGKKIRWLEEPK